jgi:flavodoxin I
MNFLVVYFSRGGKTRKVAEAIAQELGCEAVDVKKETPDVSGVELLIVGSGEYGWIHKTLQGFLDSLQPSSNKKAAVFATAGGPKPKCIRVIQEALETKGYKVISSFKCRGQLLFFLNRGHPTEDDLKNAKAFASDLKKKIGD